MKANIPIEKNKDYKIEITGVGHNGEGVGKYEGFTVFVPGAIYGEKANVKIIKVEKSFAIGRINDIIEASVNRTEPVCSVYKRCGGCQLQHINYKGQLDFKRQRVVDAIERIGKLENIEIHQTLGMDNPYRYRNKVQLPVEALKGEVKIGFYAPRSHEIVDMDICHIQDETADAIIGVFRKWIKDYGIDTYNENNSTGFLRHIMLRRAFKTGELMIVIVTNEERFKCKEELLNLLLKNIEGITSIIQNINQNRTNVILGNKCITLWGKDTITDHIGKFKFNISPLAFFQVNPVQTEVLYNKALEYAGLTGSETVFDAYCGTGTISLFLAQGAQKVFGVEIVPEAIENAIENAKNNNISNAEFIVGEAEKVIPELIQKGIHAEVVVVDPPRKGCDPALLNVISQMSPMSIVYVSCDPGTLARDLGILSTLGYKTLEVQPVDMFPQTAHVECVALIERK